MKIIRFLWTPLFISGCAAQGILGGSPSGISSTAAGLFGIPAAAVYQQIMVEIQQIQMLKAQLDGTPLPAIPAASPTTVPTTLPMTVPVVPSGSGTTGTVTPGPIVVTQPPLIAPPPPQTTVP